MEDLLQVGVITTTHGVRGEVKAGRRRRGVYERLYLFGSPVTCGYGGEIGVNKSVQVSVHDSVDVAGFKPGSGVLNQGIRHG